jgi:AcrR family transcriptional regulator
LHSPEAFVTARKKTTPRKRPVQDRAVFTVDAILEAATYILVKDGWDKFTTNRVAERAGVNIASVYQYFPNKESIVVELQRRHIDKARQNFPHVMPVLQSQRSLRAVLKIMIDAAVAEHRLAPALHRVFAEELPRSARRHAAARRDEEIGAEWAAVIERFLKNVPDTPLAMFLCRVVVHAAIHEAATERPELLDDPLFGDEVVTLLEGFLRRPA